MKSLFRLMAICLVLVLQSSAHAICGGKFYNPINDLCWSCMFPIEIFGKALFDFDQFRAAVKLEAGTYKSCDGRFSCRCGEGANMTCGVPTGFSEPARHFDVTKSPGCMPGIGADIDMSGLPGGTPGSSTKKGDNTNSVSFNHVNVYIDPVLGWTGLITDAPCLENTKFDLVFFTPADACWEDEDLCNFLSPEAFLFANMATILSCTADCVLQTTAQMTENSEWLGDANRMLIRQTYWCAGCNGHTFPISGRKSDSNGDLADTQLVGQRVFTRMHRTGLSWGTSGPKGMCGVYLQPMMDKTTYKVQMLYPSPATEKIFGRCCQLFGNSTNLWGVGKTWPITGEDYSFMVFRRRDCCLGLVGADTVGNAVGGQ